MLANNYRLTGDRKNWLATIDESLKQEDYGLDHAYTQTEVANRLMGEGDFQAALPYAQAAGESYMSLGLKAAARCREGLGDWEEAEQWVRADAERYDQPMEYFLWCVRTGHGDRKSASAAADRWAGSVADSTDYGQMAQRLSFYLLVKESEAAREAARRMLNATGEPWAGIHLALLDIERGDAAAADAAFDVVEKRGPDYKVPWSGSPRPEMVRVAGLLRRCLAAGPKAELDLNAVEQAMIGGQYQDEIANIDYFVARFLELRGKGDEAEPYMERAAKGAKVDTNTLLAMQTLRAPRAARRPPTPQ
ncbi:MAG TPA: hypothetical protein VGI81_16795 [Tepidisphaeraceae bacterium]|jgi:tetratricopeptide (TPR) repeat protein